MYKNVIVYFRLQKMLRGSLIRIALDSFKLQRQSKLDFLSSHRTP